MAKLGYIGLGKMGRHMVDRMLEVGHDVVVYDKREEPMKQAERNGAECVGDIAELVASLETPRLIWVMVPHQAVDAVLDELVPHLDDGDTVIDGGNTPYADSKRRAASLKKQDIQFLDIGVSGGPSGARNGACMMIGGDTSVFEEHESLFKDLTVKNGYAHVGPSGAGHFVKMVHNGIEYGMMQAIAEGFDVLHQTPEFDFDLKQVADVYTNGSVIESRLVGWLASAFNAFGQDLEGVSDVAVGTGEGKWTVEMAKKLGVPVRVIEDAWQARKDSESSPNYQAQIIMALRNRFGGHDVEITIEE